MNFFNKISILILTAAAVASTGCFKPGSHRTENSTSTFYLEEVTGASQVTSTSEQWNLPTSRTYSFKVMIRDSHSKDAVINHNFAIQDAEGNVLVPSVRTNADGTITWSEVINFNFLSDTKYIPLTRIIVASGIHTGKQVAKIAINPWYERHKKNQLKDVVDLSRVQIEASQLVQDGDAKLHLAGLKQNSHPRRRLYVDGMIIQMSSTGPNAKYGNKTIKLDLIPQILLHDIYNNPEGIALQKARFKVEVSLIARIAEGEKTKRYLLGKAESSQIQQMIGDRVKFDIIMNQVYSSSMGQSEVAIKLTPIEGPKDLDPFEGVFLVGTYDQNTGFVGNVPSLVSLKGDYKFHVENYVKDNVIDLKNWGPNELPSGIFAIEPYEFSFIDPRFSQVDIAQESPTSRTCKITFQTVVTNPLDGNRPVRDAWFEIRGIDGSIKRRKTNQRGELSWTDKLTYQPYKFKHYISQEVTFSETTSGWSKNFTVRINPWSQFGYALGMDNRLTGDDDKNDEKLIIEPEVYMNKYVLALNENLTYAVNDDLSITPYKSFILNLMPYVLTYSDPINGMDSVYAFRDGMYLVKLGVVSVIGGQRYVTTFKKLVNVRNSQINEPIRLHMPDLRQMRIRNLIYIEFHAIDYKKLTPFLILTKGRAQFTPEGEKISLTNLDDIIDHDAGLKHRTFVGVFTPFQPKSEAPVRPTDDLDEFYDIDNSIGSFTSHKNLLNTLKLDGVDTKIIAPNEKKLERVPHPSDAIRYQTEMIPVDKIDAILSGVNKVLTTITPDNLNSAFKGLTTFLSLMQDPKFNSGQVFSSNADVTKFVTRSSSRVIKPITVADLEKEEKELALAREKLTREKMKKENFLAHAYSEYVQIEGETPLASTNVLISKSSTLNNFIHLLNRDNFIAGVRNNLYPDSNKPNKPVGEQTPSPKWLQKVDKHINDFQNFGNKILGRFWSNDYVSKHPYYFEFDKQELEKLLPSFEPVAEVHKQAIKNLMASYFNTTSKIDELVINFDIPKTQVKTGQSISKIAATRLCSFWHNVMLSPLGRVSNKFALTRACIKHVLETDDMESIFVLDQKIRVLERGRYIMDHGYFTRLNIGSDVRASFGQSSSESSSVSISPLRVLSFLPDFVNSLFSWTYFQKNLAHDMGEGKSSNIGAGTPISTEEARFYMVINAYERCAIIRMNPEYVLEHNLLDFYGVSETSESVGWFKRGVMFCSGKVEKIPFLAPESFYYLTPDPFDGSALEISDPRNYKWVIGFRGARDYTEFFNMLKKNGVDTYGGGNSKGKYRYKDLLGADVGRISNLKREIDANKKPAAYIDLGIEDFKNSTGGTITTYPGVYTVP